MENESPLKSIQNVVIDDDNLTNPEPKVKTELELETYSHSLTITLLQADSHLFSRPLPQRLHIHIPNDPYKIL